MLPVEIFNEILLLIDVYELDFVKLVDHNFYNIVSSIILKKVNKDNIIINNFLDHVSLFCFNYKNFSDDDNEPMLIL